MYGLTGGFFVSKQQSKNVIPYNEETKFKTAQGNYSHSLNAIGLSSRVSIRLSSRR